MASWSSTKIEKNPSSVSGLTYYKDATYECGSYYRASDCGVQTYKSCQAEACGSESYISSYTCSNPYPYDCNCSTYYYTPTCRGCSYDNGYNGTGYACGGHKVPSSGCDYYNWEWRDSPKWGIYSSTSTDCDTCWDDSWNAACYSSRYKTCQTEACGADTYYSCYHSATCYGYYEVSSWASPVYDSWSAYSQTTSRKSLSRTVKRDYSCETNSWSSYYVI